MKSISLLAACTLMLAACSSNTPGEKHPLTDSAAASSDEKKAAFTVDAYKGFPEGIEGCTCYFSRTEQELDSLQFIASFNYDSLAVISVNGKMERLKLSGQEGEGDGWENTTQIFSNGDWEARIGIKKSERAGEELNKVKGEIRIKSKKDGATVKEDFTGECGC